MTGWKSLSVAARLTLAFGVVIALAMAGTGMALQALSGVQAHFEEVMHRHGRLIDLGSRMSAALYASTESLRDATLLADPAARAEGLQRLKERRKVLNDVIAEARKAVDEPQENAALDTLVDALKAGRAGSGLALEMVAAGKLEDANRQVAEKVLPSIPPVQKAVEAFVALEVRLRDEALANGEADYRRARNTLLAGAVFIVLLAATVGTLVTRSITRQLGGEPALAVQVASAVSHGDLSHAIRTTPGDAESLMAQLKLMQDSLVRLVSTVRQDAEGVAAAAAQVAQGSQDLSERTEQQAASLQQTAASMEQLGSAVHQNSDHARQASQYAHEAAGVAVKGGEVVNEVVQTMKTIDDSAHRIAEIIGTVDSIAFQTNILALNAAVEAARAGEQGRGFAVVAGEVRTLAQRTTDAAREIKTLIGDSVERVGHGSALVQQAGATMAEIVASIQRVRDVMDDITTASTQQSDGVTQASAAVAQMDQATQQNASLVEESTAAARELNRQADELVGAVRAFRLS